MTMADTGTPTLFAHAARDQAALKRMLALWDQGSKTVRARILGDFIHRNRNKTAPQLEKEFANGASLFLTRLTAWLRLTFLAGTYVSLQLEAIGVFVSAASGHRFLGEFLEDDMQLVSLKILQSIAMAGRKYKEILCASDAIKYIVKYLPAAKSKLGLQAAKAVLVELGTGNPGYEDEVCKRLMETLTESQFPGAQQVASQVLRQVLQTLKATDKGGLVVTVAMVEPVLCLHASLDLQVQYEACELSKVLASFEVVVQPLLVGLVSMLTLGNDGLLGGAASISLQASVDSALVQAQQASAAKTLAALASMSRPLAARIVNLQGVQGLLCAMGRKSWPGSQGQSSTALRLFLSLFPSLHNTLQHAFGDTLYQIVVSPDFSGEALTDIQAESLLENKVHVKV